jgi:hypothetical protein
MAKRGIGTLGKEEEGVLRKLHLYKFEGREVEGKWGCVLFEIRREGEAERR